MSGKGKYPENYPDLLASAITHDIVGPLAFGTHLLRAMLQTGTDEKTLAAVCDSLEQARIKAEGLLCLMRAKLTSDTGTATEGVTTDLCRTAGEKIRVLENLYPTAVFIWKKQETAQTSANAAVVSAVVENLLVNAAKYSPAGKNIVVKSFEKDGKAILEVKNETYGNTAEIVAGLSPNPRLTPSGRTSIGLYLSQSLAKVEGGNVKLYAMDNNTVLAEVSFPANK